MKFVTGKLETLFAFMAIIFGALIIYLTPPMCSPDEGTHFIHSCAVSSGQFFPQIKDNAVGRYLPKYIQEFIANNAGRLDGQYDLKYSYKEMLENRKDIDQSSENVFVSVNTSGTGISLIAYFIPGIGMSVLKVFCRIFHFPYATAYNILIMGRLANLLFYSVVIYLALKIIPCCKNIMFMIALMPMSIFLGASLNYDSILIATSLYYFAVLMRILCVDNYQISKKDIISVCFVTFWLVGIKQMYAPLLLLLLFVPIKKFKDKKQYFLAMGSVVITGIVSYIPVIIMNIRLSNIQSWNREAELAQKQYVLNNLLNFFVIVARTFKEQLSSYTVSFIGSLGNLDTSFLMPIILIFAMLLIVISLYDISKIGNIDIKIRIGTGVLIFLIILASCYVLYVGWTSIPGLGGIGYPIVGGLQGRYFIPLFIFGISIFSNTLLLKIDFFKVRLPLLEIKVDYIVKTAMIVMDVLTVLVILLRYYI